MLSWKENQMELTKKLFIADAKTYQIFWGFAQLSSAIVGGDIPVQNHVQTAGFLP